jgi:hypothetical protein
MSQSLRILVTFLLLTAGLALAAYGVAVAAPGPQVNHFLSFARLGADMVSPTATPVAGETAVSSATAGPTEMTEPAEMDESKDTQHSGSVGTSKTEMDDMDDDDSQFNSNSQGQDFGNMFSTPHPEDSHSHGSGSGGSGSGGSGDEGGDD